MMFLVETAPINLEKKNTRGSGSLSLSACSFGPLASSIEFGKADRERETTIFDFLLDKFEEWG